MEDSISIEINTTDVILYINFFTSFQYSLSSCRTIYHFSWHEFSPIFTKEERSLNYITIFMYLSVNLFSF